MSNVKFELAKSILKLTKTDLFIDRELHAGCEMVRDLVPFNEYERMKSEITSNETFNLIMNTLATELSNNPLNVLEELEKFYKSATYELIQATMGPLHKNMIKVVEEVAYTVGTRSLNKINPDLYKLNPDSGKIMN